MYFKKAYLELLGSKLLSDLWKYLKSRHCISKTTHSFLDIRQFFLIQSSSIYL